MIKTIALYILIKIHYPCNDIDVIRYYNSAIDKALKEYCWINLEYDLVSDDCKDYDLDIYTDQSAFTTGDLTLGTTTGSYLYNRKVFGTPYIRLSSFCSAEVLPHIAAHEIGHFLGLHHSNDELSLMYPFFSGNNKVLTRHDSLSLFEIYFR